MIIYFRSLLIDREASEQSKENAQRSLVEFCRKISSAIDFNEGDQPKTEPLLKRVYEIYQVRHNYIFCIRLSKSHIFTLILGKCQIQNEYCKLETNS